MSGGVYGGIVLTTMEWFSKCLEVGCSIFLFPPNHNPRVNKLSQGSICLVLVKEGIRDNWLFVGEFIVRDVKLVKGSEFQAYASRAIEIPEVPFPRSDEASWIIEFENLVRYERPVKLSECRDIRTSTSRYPLSEWKISGFTLIKPVDVGRVVEAIRGKAGYKPTQTAVLPTPTQALEVRPTHEDLVKELLELGEWLEFISEKEGWTPDNVYRLDVIWRKSPGKPPVKAFEVELSHNIDKALARLKHAYDVWNCQQLWLVVSDEASAERARKLVEPILKGAFEEIRDKVRILSWKELHELHTYLKHYRDILKDLIRK
jgi:predicted transcriptional regulator